MGSSIWEEPGHELLDKCREGGAEALTELLVVLTPLVRFVAREFSGVTGIDPEDLLQEGYISIIDALGRYDSKRRKFSSYCFSCIRNRMISSLRKNRPRLSLVPITQEIEMSLSSEESVDPFPDLDDIEQDLFQNLSFLEVSVLDAFLETGSISGASGLLRWPRKKVDNAIQRIRKKILLRDRCIL